MKAFFAAVFAFGLAYRLFLVFGVHVDVAAEFPYPYLASEARFDSIAYGAALAFLCQRAWELSGGKGLLVGLAGGFLLLMTLLVRDDVFRETIRYSIQGVALLLVFMAIYRSTAWDWTMVILEAPLIRRLGVLSYGAYLWHSNICFCRNTRSATLSLPAAPAACCFSPAASSFPLGLPSFPTA